MSTSFQTFIEIYKLIGSVNRVAIILSLITIVILVFNNELLKPIIAKRTNIPIPIELIIIVGGTLLSKIMKMSETWSIIPVGDIPVGLPEAVVPNFSLWKELLVDSFAIAFVSYSVTVSMALIFGQKLKYEIDFNQELLAMVSELIEILVKLKASRKLKNNLLSFLFSSPSIHCQCFSTFRARVTSSDPFSPASHSQPRFPAR
jgi:MFS superfamily sulfate permease-like transporter